MSEQITNDQSATYDIDAAMRRRVAEIPKPVPAVDPYARKRIGVPVRAHFDVSYTPDGRIEFGSNYDTRRILIDRHELIYVHHRKQATASAFLIHTFADRGGLEFRTWFRNRDNGVDKRIDTGGWSNMLSGSPRSHRLLETDEERLLGWVIDSGTPQEIGRIALPTDADLQLIEADREAIRLRQERWRLEDEEYQKWRHDTTVALHEDDTLLA